LIKPLAEKMTFLEDGDTVISGLTAEAAFGHSLGHMMYRLESQGASILIWGDITNHYVFSLQYPDSPVGFDDDKDQAIATRKRVLDMVAQDGILVSGHHMPFPSVGYVERAGAAYRWAPVTYQFRL
jgi:glyoxylase-like metal-dependent hydrolase (beta-lactamase superfamily II)